VKCVLLSPSEKRKKWFYSLRAISPGFLKLIEKLKQQVDPIFDWDELCERNEKSSKHLHEAADELSDVIPCSWTGDGKWKGMYCLPAHEFPPIDQNAIAKKYKEFVEDLEPVLQTDITWLIGSDLKFRNRFFFLRKCDFVRKTTEQLVIREDELKDAAECMEYFKPTCLVNEGDKCVWNEPDKDSTDEKDKPKVYSKDQSQLFWIHFAYLTDHGDRYFGKFKKFEERLSRREEIEKDYPNNLYEDDEGDDEEPKKPVKKLKKEDILQTVEKIFEKHFPSKHMLYISDNQDCEWNGIHFFIGETEDYYMGFFVFAVTV
jgi:hypothetical protein